MSPNVSINCWTPAQKLFFIELLYELHKNGEMKPEESNVLRTYSAFFIGRLKEKFPLCKWDRGRIKRHYKQVIDDYRWYYKARRMRKARAVSIFREGIETEEVHFGGPELMNFGQSHGQAAQQSLRNGLAVDGNLTLEAYHQLFSRHLSISDKETCTPEFPSGSPPAQVNPIASDFCGLARMPKELLFMIRSYLSHPEIKICTTVSKQLREIFSPQLFTSVKFLGTLEGLFEELKLFKETLKQRTNTFEQTRHVTFQFIGLHNSQASECNHDLPRLTANLIGCCLSQVNGLRDVTFDIDLKGQSPQFNQKFRPDDKWVKPRSVIFHRASGEEFKTILCSFEPTTLEAVQLPMNVKKTHYNALKSRHHSLKALHIDTSFNSNIYKQSPLRYMDPKCLEPILRDFPEVESLVLSESGCCKPGTCFEMSHWNNLNEKVEALVETLKVTKHLRRFAFGLWSSRVPAHTIRQNWQIDLQSNKQFILDFDYPGPKPTRFEVDSWYINLLQSILAKVPQLLELCIVDRQCFYRGTRSKDDIQVRALCFECLREREKFPNLLETNIEQQAGCSSL
ncbi:hypothetical protein FOXG_20938 [Fusarium oxysporum f. sp. lycopersici 4287]|uniref:F-box domain-containing protein n=1 Tax=Fusarium oxysporum f. sp. lycopersici (strain 4287 / CBS 123668 / FGSC 9935 / NRRL 34936) TaxID=426428 RepID=A0A0J9VST8_FUSO4|nr:hypothetical protein FOXG_20938 [Fusarium oxysporum f. sp. lycopersici 4287]KNB13826.1 hypothetical protein FOXG_20938 [Fusarium oxysporum f. sp. lycopersici 4287]